MSKKHNYVLGINAYDHDVSACLLRDGEIACAIAKERITREKHDSGFYQEVVDYCIEAEGILVNDIDLVVRNSYILPVEDMESRLAYRDCPSFLDINERDEASKHPFYLSKSNKVMTISHHLAHAYSAFAASPFEEGAVMIVDGVGSYSEDVTEDYPEADNTDPFARESESYYKFSGTQLETLKKVWMVPVRGFFTDDFYNMPGLGAFYSRASAYIFGDWNKCGEVMGLAPYGRPERIKQQLTLENGVLHVPEFTEDFAQPFLEEDETNWEENSAMNHWEDLAWRVQHDTEEVLIKRAIWLRETTGAKNLCIAGGVALNCVANGRVQREAGFENIWIQPAAGDDGIAIGCALYGHLAIQNNPRTYVIKNAFFGKDYGKENVEETFSNPRLARLETKKTEHEDICAETAKLLAEGNVFGWFQGRSEFGPRALGNRSIIADPRTPEMKDKLNSRVKHRQAFRPFAPIVIEDRVEEIFEGVGESPYMLIARNVRPEWRDKIPSIVHVDGTARIQTVSEQDNAKLYRLLKAFDELTGVPVLMNTSFNVKGEPIVETPGDAMDCFLSTGIDYLVLHDTIYAKTRFHKMFSPVMNAYYNAASAVNPQH